MRLTRRDALALALVLGLAALLRLGTLGLLHDRGDQLIFAGLAAHLSARGTDGYTLRHVDYRYEPLGAGATLVRFSAGAGEGKLLKVLKEGGEGFWDSPLASQPPVYPLVLLASHAALGAPGDGFPLLGRDHAWLVRSFREERGAAFAAERDALERLPESARASAREDLGRRLEDELVGREAALARALVVAPPAGAVRAQLWATLPQGLFDLATVALVYLVARPGGRRVAALAALAFACDPLGLFAAHRVLANPLVTLLALLALAVGDPDPDERSVARGVGAGLLAGLAALTKVSGALVVPALLLARRARRGRFDASDVALVAAFAALACPWWLYRASVLEHPFAQDTALQAGLAASSWALKTTGRSPAYYALVLARSPIAALGLVLSCVTASRALAGLRRGERAPAGLALAVFGPLVLAAAAVFPGKEARHILFAYPALLVAGSSGVVQLWTWVGPRGRAVLAVLVALLLGLESYTGLGWALDVGRPP